MQKRLVAQPRHLLLGAYAAAIEAVEGKACVSRYLQSHPLPDKPVTLLAIGKAAGSMARGAVEALGERISAGLLVTREGYAVQAGLPDSIRILEAGHPLPDGRSLSAGEAVLALLESLSPDACLLILLSGGSSALVEVLPQGIELNELVALNEWLLGSGLPIRQVNRVRQSVSALKGGRLAQRLRGQAALNLVISDVPGDDLTLIGSAPFYYAARADEAALDVPPWIQTMQQRASHILGPPPVAERQSVEHHLLATNRQAAEAACRFVQAEGIPAYFHATLLEGEAEEVAARLVAGLETLPDGLHVWGGETTVTLPGKPGRGGRNQHLALAAAKELAGRKDICLLAAGTDGSDGMSDDCGALVDGQTLARGEREGLSVEDCLRRADAGSFLHATGDLLTTGPTGTNVMDLLLVCKSSTA